MTDNVNHPSHYTQGGVECIDAITAATVNKTGIEAVCTGNVIKYLWRYEAKNGLEDVKKAQWYLTRLIAEMESKVAVAPEPEECDHVWNCDGQRWFCVKCLVWKDGVIEPLAPEPSKIRCKQCGCWQMPGSPACENCGEYL